MIASGQSRKLAILQLNGGEGSRRWRVPGLKTGTGRDRSSPRLSICQGVLLMKTLEASAATPLNAPSVIVLRSSRCALGIPSHPLTPVPLQAPRPATLN